MQGKRQLHSRTGLAARRSERREHRCRQRLRGLQAAGDEDCEEEAEEEDGSDVAPDVAAAAPSGQRNADVDRRALHRLPKPAAPKQGPHRPNHLLDALAIQRALRSLPGKDGHLDRPAVCP